MNEQTQTPIIFQVDVYARALGLPAWFIPTYSKRIRYTKLKNRAGCCRSSPYLSAITISQQRQMWILVTLLGNSPLVLLDEPTEDLDPAARRRFWNLIFKHVSRREQRAVLFTTADSEQADSFAERKLVLGFGGRILGFGTSRELKERFGRCRLELRRDLSRVAVVEGSRSSGGEVGPAAAPISQSGGGRSSSKVVDAELVDEQAGMRALLRRLRARSRVVGEQILPTVGTVTSDTTGVVGDREDRAAVEGAGAAADGAGTASAPVPSDRIVEIGKHVLREAGFAMESVEIHVAQPSADFVQAIFVLSYNNDRETGKKFGDVVRLLNERVLEVEGIDFGISVPTLDVVVSSILDAGKSGPYAEGRSSLQAQEHTTLLGFVPDTLMRFVPDRLTRIIPFLRRSSPAMGRRRLPPRKKIAPPTTSGEGEIAVAPDMVKGTEGAASNLRTH